jgi:hypothetical protein
LWLFQTGKLIPVVGSFGPQSNFSVAGSHPLKQTTVQVSIF